MAEASKQEEVRKTSDLTDPLNCSAFWIYPGVLKIQYLTMLIKFTDNPEVSNAHVQWHQAIASRSRAVIGPMPRPLEKDFYGRKGGQVFETQMARTPN